MNTEKEIERLRTAVVVRATDLEKKEDAQLGTAEGGFDATARRGALRLLETALSAEKHQRAAA